MSAVQAPTRLVDVTRWPHQHGPAYDRPLAREFEPIEAAKKAGRRPGEDMPTTITHYAKKAAS